MSRSEFPAPLYGPRLADALSFAATQFAFRTRKGTKIPYLTHLLQVMVTVGEYGGDEDQMIAAVLHDYLEDIRGATEEELVARFGARVTDFVVKLSDSTTHPKPPWEDRKRAYIAALRDEPAELKLISAADKLHNATSIVRAFVVEGASVFDRFTATQAQTLWYYRAVVEALAHGYSHPIVDELRVVVQHLHALAEVPHAPVGTPS